MTLVTQPSRLPTRKLSAGMIAAAVSAAIKSVILHIWPWLSDPLIWEPLPILIGFAVGYFVRDKPNVAPPKEPVRGV